MLVRRSLWTFKEVRPVNCLFSCSSVRDKIGIVIDNVALELESLVMSSKDRVATPAARVKASATATAAVFFFPKFIALPPCILPQLLTAYQEG